MWQPYDKKLFQRKFNLFYFKNIKIIWIWREFRRFLERDETALIDWFKTTKEEKEENEEYRQRKRRQQFEMPKTKRTMAMAAPLLTEDEAAEVEGVVQDFDKQCEKKKN